MNYLNRDLKNLDLNSGRRERLERILSGLVFGLTILSVYILYFILGA